MTPFEKFQALVIETDEMIARCKTCAAGYRAIGRDFSAATVIGFARDIASGMPWQLYAHWLTEAEARLERLSK